MYIFLSPKKTQLAIIEITSTDEPNPLNGLIEVNQVKSAIAQVDLICVGLVFIFTHTIFPL